MASKISIAVIGANSFLAKHLINNLDLEKYQVTLYAKNLASFDSQKYTLLPFYLPEQNVNFNDLLSQDIIVYAAAAATQAGNFYLTSTIYDVNAYTPINLVNYLDEHQYKGKFITFGSYFEIGSLEEMHYFTEIEHSQSSLKVFNQYGASKRLLTRHFYCGLHTINWFHLVLPSLYGPNEDENRLIPYIIHALQNNLPVRHSSGEQIRQYLHVYDVVSLLTDFVFVDKLKGDMYNVTYRQYIKVKELVALIYDALNEDISKSEKIVRPDGYQMKILLVDDFKINNACDWRPKISPLEGIKTYL